VIRMGKFASLAVGLFSLSTILLGSGCGSSSTHARLMNASFGNPSLDMLVDSKVVASEVGYGTASGYVSVSSGSRNLQINLAGSATSLINQTATFSSGTNSTVLATTSEASVFTDNKTAPSSGSISIRVINASSTLGTADVYIVPSGTVISNISPTISGLNYQSASSYQTLSAGSYQVIFTFTGQNSAVINSNPISFSSGQVRTVVGLDDPAGRFTSAVLSDLN
jgi:Domain of unknown function (DUF4397)